MISRLTILTFLLVTSLTYGQFGVATITGRITDPTGAVASGAVVVVTNTDTNFTYNSVANAEGIFRIPSLQPGPYKVTIEAAGFKRFLRENLDLRAGFATSGCSTGNRHADGAGAGYRRSSLAGDRDLGAGTRKGERYTAFLCSSAT
jgi:hypothetical protein